jgi:hypothetical protein
MTLLEHSVYEARKLFMRVIGGFWRCQRVSIIVKKCRFLLTHNQRVAGSSPAGPIQNKGLTVNLFLLWRRAPAKI